MTEIIYTPNFLKELKHLAKRYHSLPSDLIRLEKELSENPEMGVNLGKGLKKIRMAVTSKGKGKSGGVRIITYHDIVVTVSDRIVYLITIYDKSEKESIMDKELMVILRKYNLI
jgi:mRNA-degrading endonuclease RelE of RelBE toxin-antitoxin system